MYSTLLVDDEPHIIEALAITVNWENYGFYVSESVSNAVAALKLLKARNFDLIVTDIRMPQMNGISFIEHIRQHNTETEIIIISGYNNFEYARDAIKYKVDSYILKPIDPQEVEEQLSQIKKRLVAKKSHGPQASVHKYGNISDVVQYVNDNFAKAITLKLISEKFYFNTSYLGYKFKSVTGESFNDYLNKMRINYIKEQLQLKQNKMYELIESSGFSSHQYFYKQFKKFEGISFTEYLAKTSF